MGKLFRNREFSLWGPLNKCNSIQTRENIHDKHSMCSVLSSDCLVMIMRWRSVQIMACDKPLPELILFLSSLWLLETEFSEIWIKLQNFYFMKIRLKMSGVPAIPFPLYCVKSSTMFCLILKKNISFFKIWTLIIGYECYVLVILRPSLYLYFQNET